MDAKLYINRRRRPTRARSVGRTHFRRGMVRRIRAEIRSGDYESALKLDVALDRLLDRMLKQCDVAA